MDKSHRIAKTIATTALALFFTIPVHAQFSISQQITREIADNIARNLSANLIVPQLRIRNAAGPISDFSLSPDGKFLSLALADNTSRVWDLEQGIQRPILRPGGAAAVSARTNRAYVGLDGGVISVFNIATGEKLSSLNGNCASINRLVFSDDGTRLAAISEDGTVVIWDMLTSRPLTKLSIDTDALTSIAINRGGTLLLAGGTDEQVHLVDIMTGKETMTFKGHDDNIIKVAFLDGSKQIISGDDEGLIRIWDSGSGKLLKEVEGSDEDVSAMATSTFTALGLETGVIKLIDLTQPERNKELTGNKSAITHLEFASDGSRLFSANQKGEIFLWDTVTGKQLLQIISTKSGWSVVDHTGRFDSSEPAMNDVSWEAADLDLPLDNFSDQYYEPGLLALHLTGEKDFLSTAAVKVPAGINLPPSVSLAFPDSHDAAGTPYQIKVQATDQGGNIETVRFFHNGKLVTEAARLDQKDSQTKDQLVREITFQIKPLVGTNVFKALASNKMGIESTPVKSTKTFSGKLEPSTLHVVVIGVNKYKDSRLNLDYSVADGAAIVKLLTNKQRVNFDKVKQYVVFDEQATKKNILGLLKELEDIAPQDIVVAYLAGHGLTIKGDWYFLPHETVYGSDEEYFARVGISAQEFKEQMVGVNAQQIMIMIDACQSGRSLKVFNRFLDSQRRYSRALSRGVGITVLAATRKDQDAAEIVELGHGLFTYVVLEGLNGDADIKSIDGYISAHEVVEYSKLNIPAYLKRFSDATQEPTAFTLGADFNLIGKNR